MGTRTTIEVPADEWLGVGPLVTFAAPDEFAVLGMLRMVGDGARRYWWSGDGRRVVRQRGGTDDGTYDILLSPRLVEFAFGRALTGEAATIDLVTDDDGSVLAVTARTDTQALTVAADPRAYPSIDEVFASELAADGAWAEVDAEELAALIDVARRRPTVEHIDDEEPDPLFWLAVVGGEGIMIDLRWPGLGLTEFQLRARAEGSRTAAVPPSQLADALIGLEGPITVVVPDFAHNAIRVSSADRDALILPIETTFERMRFSTEQVLAEVFGPTVVQRDTDGHYRLSHDIPVFARLVDDEPVRIQVFAVAVDGVEHSAELLSELNDHNARLGFARCFWMNDQVLVECDLMAGTTEAAELQAAHERVLTISRELGPLLAAVFGGTPAETHVGGAGSGNWDDYLRTVVAAELVDGTLTPISDADAWPYPGTVWALTSDNPMGTWRSDEENQAARPELIAAVDAAGARHHRSVGTSVDTEHSEVGLVVWDTDRDTVLDIARRFRQEAIFEIDPDEVRVIACFDDRAAARPRGLLLR